MHFRDNMYKDNVPFCDKIAWLNLPFVGTIILQEGRGIYEA